MTARETRPQCAVPEIYLRIGFGAGDIGEPALHIRPPWLRPEFGNPGTIIPGSIA